MSPTMEAADVEGHGCNANIDVEEASQLAETPYETQVEDAAGREIAVEGGAMARSSWTEGPAVVPGTLKHWLK